MQGASSKEWFSGEESGRRHRKGKVWQVKEKEREKFALVLKRKEIKEDFMMLIGHRCNILVDSIVD